MKSFADIFDQEVQSKKEEVDRLKSPIRSPQKTANKRETSEQNGEVSVSFVFCFCYSIAVWLFSTLFSVLVHFGAFRDEQNICFIPILRLSGLQGSCVFVLTRFNTRAQSHRAAKHKHLLSMKFMPR